MVSCLRGFWCLLAVSSRFESSANGGVRCGLLAILIVFGFTRVEASFGLVSLLRFIENIVKYQTETV